ncbi:hypothetical protein DFH09DRAFT_1098598 [Mycena vulgaris]|nr:hypothetical protein DFH09DRAFT_1098598 [Mycena vulgaris]
MVWTNAKVFSFNSHQFRGSNTGIDSGMSSERPPGLKKILVANLRSTEANSHGRLFGSAMRAILAAQLYELSEGRVVERLSVLMKCPEGDERVESRFHSGMQDVRVRGTLGKPMGMSIGSGLSNVPRPPTLEEFRREPELELPQL